MSRHSLLEFFEDVLKNEGDFLVYDDGYRSWTYTYAETSRAAHAFAARLRSNGVQSEDKVIIWSENRPEWLVALGGCMLAGAIAVPLDYRSSALFVARVAEIVKAPIAVIGEQPEGADKLADRLQLWPITELFQHAPAASPASRADPDDTAEIIFTSGATAEPKGVIITHRNILANIVPVERELGKYRRYIRFFSPIRFLNLLPLSHMFGQAMAAFIPPMLPGIVVFLRGHNPAEIIRQVKQRRISVIVCVPKILELLREHVLLKFPELEREEAIKPGVLGRWWRYRRIHRLFGFKFWAFVVGAAPLDPALEAFWTGLGFAVIQGYGLTETAPIVTLNHPLRSAKGSVGRPMHGVEVKIASDGEVLVRGENVTKGYYGAGAEAAAAFDSEGWFHTGDIGELDETGRLSIKGRKKEMIVTPEGLNVFPQDVERVLNDISGIKESAVVGIEEGGRERVHAVIVPETKDSIDAAAVAREVNSRLEDHQKIRNILVWPSHELPRTEGTRKLKRRDVKAWILQGALALDGAQSAHAGIQDLVARYASGRSISSETTLDELGLSSLERVELLTAIEGRYGATLPETALLGGASVKDIEKLASQSPATTATETFEFPSWNRSAPAYWLRRLSLPTWILPIARIFAWIKVEGREHLNGLTGPIIFASNHQSHMDTPVIYAAMPARYRYRVATAMSKEFFRAHFYPEQHSRREYLTNSLNYVLAAEFFNAFPIPQRESGARQTLRYAGELISGGWSILIYPEGKRTHQGEIQRFQAGVGMMAARLHVPVVPVRIVGLDRVLHQSWKMARPGRVRVIFGKPLALQGDDYSLLARRVEDAVRGLSHSMG